MINMSKYGRHGRDESKYLMRVGSLGIDKWPAFMQSMGHNVNNIPRGGSKQYSCEVDDKGFMLYATFAPDKVHLAASSQREYVREQMRSVSNGSKRN